MSNCNFHVGQKVVCVMSTVTKINDLGLPGFVKGDVLTVAEVFMHDAHGALSQEEVFLKFVETGPNKCGHHIGFRPVVERKTDISCFKAMLNPTRSAVPA